MSVSQVNIYSDVYQACLTHALSTEKEEVMGLLIGTHSNTNRGLEAYLHALMLLRRSDKRRDRVEISAEQQAEASTYAENLARSEKQSLRVCGWYHSHPHITVHPSHVDVNTQSNYQTMDPHFVGLIFSVFSNDAENLKKPAKIEVKCFQAENNGNGLVAVEVTLNVIPREYGPSRPCLKAMISLPNILFEEEVEAYDDCTKFPMDPLTAMSNNAIFTKALSGIISNVSGPLLNILKITLENCQTQLSNQVEQGTSL